MLYSRPIRPRWQLRRVAWVHESDWEYTCTFAAREDVFDSDTKGPDWIPAV